jgi:regulatory protein
MIERFEGREATPPAAPLSGTITAIETQARDPERVNVFLDGRFAFGLNARVVADAALRPGDTLSARRVAGLLQRDDVQQALLQAFGYLSYRPRTAHELRRYLAQKGRPPETIDSVLARLAEYHYVDDEVFALNWVETRQRFRPRGARLLRAELAQKGVERETIDQAIADAGADERALALDVAQAKVGSLKAADYQEFGRRLGGFLMRRGFAPDVVWDVVRDLWKARDGDAPPLD